MAKSRHKSSDPGLDLEYFIRCELSWLLNLSPSKQVAVEMVFFHFADYIRALARKAPGDYELFAEELQKRMRKVASWRAPRGRKVVPLFYGGKLERFPNGKIKYYLSEKNNWTNKKTRE